MAEFTFEDLDGFALSRRGHLISKAVPEVAGASVSFLKEEFQQREVFERCVWFSENILREVPSARVDLWRRVGFFPWIETEEELDHVLQHAVIGYYKSTYDHLRRALELALVAVLFTSENFDPSQGQKWLRSERNTPFFSRTVKDLAKAPRFETIVTATDWRPTVKKLFGRLSDVVHVRGTRLSFSRLQPPALIAGGVFVPSFNRESLRDVLATYVEVVRHIATVAAISNPMLIVPMPLYRKFGLKPPMSGFLETGDAERVEGLVLPSVLPTLRRLVAEDEDVQAVSADIMARPDLTTEELEQQAEANEEWMRSMGDEGRRHEDSHPGGGTTSDN